MTASSPLPRLTFVIALLLAASVSPCKASGLHIEQDDPASPLKLEIDNLRAEAVLEQLARKYGFVFVNAAKTPASAPVSMTLAGSLKEVIERLLRNRNYLIVQGASEGQMQKVVLIGVPARVDVPSHGLPSSLLWRGKPEVTPPPAPPLPAEPLPQGSQEPPDTSVRQ